MFAPVVARRRGALVFACCVALLAIAAPTAFAESTHARLVKIASAPNGAQRLTYKVGPFNIIPGQNDIQYAGMDAKPKVDGWITRMRPDLVYTDGRVPRVDVLHLHHGVWLNLSRQDATSPGLPERFFAAGEEKTIMSLPKGYGYPYKATDKWLLNHMIHNLTPVPAKVYMELEIDFIPATSAAAKGMKAVRPIWMDVRNGQLYPVFNVKKGAGKKGTYTYPNDEPNAYAGGKKQNEWTVDRDGTLVATAGHLHPGGLHTDLWLRRSGAKVAKPACASKGSSKARKRCRKRAPRGYGSNVHLFTSRANYFEPAGAVSWDVAMTGTRPSWRVPVKKGDTLWTSATYNTKRGSWWESMGIMVVYMADGTSGKNPFRSRIDYAGNPTHGHLRENRHHGGGKTNLPDPRKLPDGPSVGGGNVDILDFKYEFGDFSLTGAGKNPPVIPQGQSATFTNLEAGQRLYHSITSCKAPCNRATGIAYPLADSKVQFESNTLGTQIPAAGSTTWTTPSNLKPGTYTYFCRIHPFMRGAFRVK
jgi:plastocyanin